MAMQMGQERRALAAAVWCVLGLLAVPAGAVTPDLPLALVDSAARGSAAHSAVAGLDGPFAGVARAPALADYQARWRTVAEGVAEDRTALAACREAPANCSEAARRFAAVIEAGRGKQGRARLGEINRAVNLAIVATTDLAQHGTSDVWSSALATFASGRGDCEDYAIAKYTALLETGMPAQDLRLAVVRDARRGGHHVVLAARLDGRWLVLDNTRLLLLEDREALWHYTPVAALGHDGAPILTSAGAPSNGGRDTSAPGAPDPAS